MSKASREKGKRGERELAAELRRLGFIKARRGIQYQGGPDSPDVADAIAGVHIECKRVELLRLHEAVFQALADAEPGDAPIVAHRRSRQPWMVTLPLEFLELLARRVVRELDGGPDETA